MNPDAVLTFTPFDVRFSRWVRHESGWSEAEQEQALTEYLQIRALESRDDQDGDEVASLQVIRTYAERERQYHAGILSPEAFRRHHVAFEAGFRGNSVATLVAMIDGRVGRMDFASLFPTSRPPSRLTRPQRYQFSAN